MDEYHNSPKHTKHICRQENPATHASEPPLLEISTPKSPCHCDWNCHVTKFNWIFSNNIPSINYLCVFSLRSFRTTEKKNIPKYPIYRCIMGFFCVCHIPKMISLVSMIIHDYPVLSMIIWLVVGPPL